MTDSLKVPFVDLKLQYKNLASELEKTLLKTSASASYILGPQVAEFELEFARYVGTKYAIGVASGTDALKLSCQALGIGRRSEVLIPANTFIATALGVFDLGFKVIPVDINPTTYLMDLKDAEKKISKNTRAILPVHLYGQVMDLEELCSFAENHQLHIIEDACQSHGARWKGKGAGSAGSVGCFSFFPSKNLGAFGDGGMITTNVESIAKQLRMIRNYGSDQKYVHEIPGTNSRLDTIQAAVLQIKLPYLDTWNLKRFHAACRYTDGLKNVRQIRTPAFNREDHESHVFHLYVIECEQREGLAQFLSKKGIQTGIHYPVPIHMHPSMANADFQKGTCPVAENLSDRILSLPMFPEISNNQLDHVIASIIKFYN
jgi:dTDP-4-amino-4,6-dideoxygalactose transaminase